MTGIVYTKCQPVGLLRWRLYGCIDNLKWADIRTSKWEVNWLDVENWHHRETHSEVSKHTDLEAKLQQASDIVEFMEHVMVYEEWIGELEKVTSELEETRQKLERDTQTGRGQGELEDIKTQVEGLCETVAEQAVKL